MTSSIYGVFSALVFISSFSMQQRDPFVVIEPSTATLTDRKDVYHCDNGIISIEYSKNSYKNGFNIDKIILNEKDITSDFTDIFNNEIGSDFWIYDINMSECSKDVKDHLGKRYNLNYNLYLTLAGDKIFRDPVYIEFDKNGENMKLISDLNGLDK